MAKLTMQKIEIVALLTDSKKIVERLQRRGVLELTRFDDEQTVRLNTAAQVQLLEKNLQTAERALEQLNLYAPENTGLKGMFTFLDGRTAIEKHRFGELAERPERYLNLCFEILNRVRTVQENNAAISRNQALYDQLAPWRELDIPQRFSGTENVACAVGSLPGAFTAEQLTAELGKAANTDLVEAKVLPGAKEQTRAVVFCHRSVQQAVLAAARKLGFAQPADPTAHPPKVRLERYLAENKRLQTQIEENTKALKALSGRQRELHFLIDLLTLKRDQYRALQAAGTTDKTLILCGWIAQKNALPLTKELEKRFSVAITVSNPPPEEDPPVLLENNRFNAPAEAITEMYALPNRQDTDPTPIFAFFYYLFFGMMLSDAGYGLVMTLVTGLILKKSKVEGTLRRSLKMFFYCGISTVFWGALFGSWFGDIIPVIAKNYFHTTVTTSQIALWFEPMANPVKLLLVSFLLGIIHLFVGVAVNCWQLLRQHKVFDAVFDTLPVYCMILGIMPFGAGIFVPVNSRLSTYGLYLAAAGAVIFVLTSARASRNPLKRLLGGLYGMYNFASGWLGDILSYSRLLALGLATGSIAGVINMMATMPENMVLKTVLLLIVFPLGHGLNIAVNLLGAYVHAARLQFVELFSKFYEGGGRAFAPLKVQTQYVKFKEENEL